MSMHLAKISLDHSPMSRECRMALEFADDNASYRRANVVIPDCSPPDEVAGLLQKLAEVIRTNCCDQAKKNGD